MISSGKSLKVIFDFLFDVKQLFYSKFIFFMLFIEIRETQFAYVLEVRLRQYMPLILTMQHHRIKAKKIVKCDSILTGPIMRHETASCSK